MTDWHGKGFRIGDLNIPVPIVQGGMGIGISLSSLASAVANEGGIGVISAAGVGIVAGSGAEAGPGSAPGCAPEDEPGRNARALRAEIRKARSMTRGVLGVNIMMALTDFPELVTAASAEGIDVIFAGAGLPLKLPELVAQGSKTKLVPIVSSAKAVKLIAKWWGEKYGYCPDGFVVEGPMAGGHLGFKAEQVSDPEYRLENLVQDVLGQVRLLEEEKGREIPVIAAGGIFSGEDIYRFLKLGASAVQMATRFVATEECDADPLFKQAYVDCRPEDITIIESPVGLPGRAIMNDFIRKSKAGEMKPRHCLQPCLSTCKQGDSPYCITSALVSAYRGNLDHGFAFIGANGYKVDRILPVSQLLESLKQEYDNAEQRERNELG